MKKPSKKRLNEAAIEIACDTLEKIGCEVDMQNCYVDDIDNDGDRWITLRVRVPALNIEERVAQIARREVSK